MSETKSEIVTFRIEAALKDEFAEIAEAEHKAIGTLLRELVRQHVSRCKRLAFEAEARRQSLECAEAAKEPSSDEAQVMRELDANFDELMRELDQSEAAALRRRK